MKLFIGLGNAGQSYENNRHNFGFTVIDKIAENYSLGGWRDKFRGSICDCIIANKKVMLLKPSNYMNNSGYSTSELINFYKIPLNNVFIFFDDIELSPGKIRVKLGGGHAGHNGIRDIIQKIGGDFWKVRLGIGHPGSKQDVGNYVLGNFSNSDQRWVNLIISEVVDNLSLLVNNDINNFMNIISISMNKIELPLSPRDIKHNQEKS